METLEQIKSLMNQAETEGRDLTEEELEQVETLAKSYEVEPITPPTPEEGTEMNAPAPIEVIKTIELNTPAELTLAEQIQKALPDINKGQGFNAEISTKGLGITGTNTSNTGGTKISVPSEWAGFQLLNRPLKNRLFDVIPHRAITGQTVNYVQLSLTNSAVAVKELGLKPQSAIPAMSVTAEPLTFAHWIEISKQLLSDASGIDSAISQLLMTGLINAVDASIYTEVAKLATAYTPTLTGSDIFAEIKVKLESQGATDVVIAINQTDYLSASIKKTTGSGEYLGISPVAPSNIISCPSVPVGKLLAFDPSALCYFERETANIQVGYSADQFVKNAVTILAELRGIAGVLNPNLVLSSSVAVPLDAPAV